MRKGQTVRFDNLSSPLQVKQLNDVLNYIMMTCEDCFDIVGNLRREIFSQSYDCQAGQAVTVTYPISFCAKPSVVVYAENGGTVSISALEGDLEMKSGLLLTASGSGMVSVIATGMVKLK